MESERLLIRPMRETDESAFAKGIGDRTLRVMYGFPSEMDETVPPKIFRRFLGLPGARTMAEKDSGRMAGFLLDADPELPAELAAGLPPKGRTLAFAVFLPYRRRGYMQETLETYIPYLFREGGADYIHCGHFPENGPSGKLLKKLGFQEYGSHTFNGRTIVDEILFRQNE